jgi:hypothetical protein
LNLLKLAFDKLNDKIFRAKGIVLADEKKWYVDYSGQLHITPVSYLEEAGKLVVLYDIALVSKKEIVEVFQTLSKK